MRASNLLGIAIDSLIFMARKPVFAEQGDPETLPAVWVLARNLKDAMDNANNGTGISQNALARKSGVAQTGIGYMLNPDSRLQSIKGKQPSPTLAKIEKVALALDLEAWQLLHPNPAESPLSNRQRKLFEALTSNMRWIKGRQKTPVKP